MPDTAIVIKKTPAPRESVPDVWRSFRNEIDRLFDRFDGGFRLPSMRRMFDLETSFGFDVPAVDVTKDDKAHKVTAELPGLDEMSIEVLSSGDRLVLKGEKRQEKEERDKNYYLSERCYGSFQRSFRLPDGINRDKIAATFAKGALTLTLLKTVEAPKQQKKSRSKRRDIPAVQRRSLAPPELSFPRCRRRATPLFAVQIAIPTCRKSM